MSFLSLFDELGVSISRSWNAELSVKMFDSFFFSLLVFSCLGLLKKLVYEKKLSRVTIVRLITLFAD